MTTSSTCSLGTKYIIVYNSTSGLTRPPQVGHVPPHLHPLAPEVRPLAPQPRAGVQPRFGLCDQIFRVLTAVNPCQTCLSLQRPGPVGSWECEGAGCRRSRCAPTPRTASTSSGPRGSTSNPSPGKISHNSSIYFLSIRIYIFPPQDQCVRPAAAA